MLKKLRKMFLGKLIRISHTDNKLGVQEGQCISVETGSCDEFTVEIDEGVFYFVPEVITKTSAEGPLRAEVGGRRKIEAIQSSLS